VRKSGLGLRRPSPEHQIAARLRHLDRSQRQRRLADPRLADQHGSRERPIRRSKQIDESCELVLPTNDGPNINCHTHVLERVYDPALQTWSQASAAPPSTLRNARADAQTRRPLACAGVPNATLSGQRDLRAFGDGETTVHMWRDDLLEGRRASLR